MPIINIGNGMFLDTSTGQMSSNQYGSTPSTGALTTSISAPVVQATAATPTPAPVTPPAGALTQAIAAPTPSPIGTGGLPAQQAQAAPTPSWFTGTPIDTSYTIGGGDSGGDTVSQSRAPTAAELAQQYATWTAGGGNAAFDPSGMTQTLSVDLNGSGQSSSGTGGQPAGWQKDLPDGSTQFYDTNGNLIRTATLAQKQNTGGMGPLAELGVQAFATMAGGPLGSGLLNTAEGLGAGQNLGQALTTGAKSAALSYLAGQAAPTTPTGAVSGMDLAADAGASGGNSLGAAASSLDAGPTTLQTAQGALSAAQPYVQTATKVNNIANALKNGDYANALIGGVNMSGQLPATIDGVSTSDMTKLANAALAISSGNPAALVNSMINSGKTWDAANNVWNDATGVSTTPMTDAYLASPTTDTQAALDALSLVDGPNPNPEAYALPTDLTPTNSAADQAANAAQDALLNGGALTQVVSNPTDQRLADGTQTTPGALTDVINAPAEPNAVPLDNVTVTGTQYPPADQAVQDALNQYSTEAPNAVPLDNVTVTGTQYPPADQAVMDALNQYSTEAPNAVPLDKVTVTGTQPPLSDLVPTEVNAPPTVVPVIAETPPATVPTVPTIPSVPVVPKKTAPATPKTIAPLPQQVANHLPGVDMSFLNPGATIDENKLMPMAQALVDQSNGTLTLPEALGMVKQNQPKGKQ